MWFDVGETLIDESREYGTWADWLGVPRHTFSAVSGAVIARGGDYQEVFQYFRSGCDLQEERQVRLETRIGGAHDWRDIEHIGSARDDANLGLCAPVCESSFAAAQNDLS